ncbi:MAG: lysophospholipid acyltransferase family protein [Mucilaginibacter sp.]
MKLILKKAHVHFYRLSVAFIYVLCYPFLYFLAKDAKRYPVIVKFRRFLAGASSGMAGIFYRIECEEPVDRNQAYVVSPNHTSNLDIPAMCMLVNSNCSFMGKEELTGEAVTNFFFRTIDVPVNRDSKMSSYRAYKKAVEKLNNSVSMIIFPEGGIADDYPPQLQPFKNGLFKLAIECGAPVLPVTIVNSWHLMWDSGLKYGSRPGICHIFVHKPIATTGLTVDDADALRDKVYDMIKQKLAEYDHR